MIIFTKREAAELLKCSTVTLDRARRAGLLAYRKVGDRVLFSQEDIEAFLALCAVQVRSDINE